MKGASAEVRERAGRIELILVDSDGVLTDGRIYMSSDGSEFRAFDVTDGHGIRMGAEHTGPRRPETAAL